MIFNIKNSFFLILFKELCFTKQMYTSQWGQDKFIDDLFNHKENGIFVDIGAHNGKTLSNTYFLETQRKWTGICFEPIPEIFEELERNRRCVCIEGCAYNKICELNFKKLTGHTEMLSGIVETFHPNHLERINNELQAFGGTEENIKVQAFTLSSILSKYNITHVDYLTIDTEGSELQVLEGIDFNNVDITYIDIEHNYSDYIQDVEYLVSKNYSVIHNIGNDVIFKKDS